MEEFIIGASGWGRLLARHREINHQRTPDDIRTRDESPVTAVGAALAIVTQNEVVARGHHQLAMADVLGESCAPGHAGQVCPKLGREVVTVTVSGPGFVSGVILLERGAVDVNLAVEQVNAVARNANHTLYKILRAVHRVMEHDDFTALDIAIGQQPAHSARVTK